jgi:predicted SprT family Zn-dependent metalloprotease
LLNLKYSDFEITEKRNKIYRQFISTSLNVKNGVITKISEEDLKLLFDLYNSIFFKGYFDDDFKSRIKFSLSSRMTRSAGKTIYPKNLINMKVQDAAFEIRMGVDFFFKYYEINEDKLVNGIKTKDSLEAFQLVFEHELCHLIELREFRTSDCKKDRFKTIAYNIFEHRDVYHALPTNAQIASAKYGFKIGDKVSFVFEDKKYKGIINNINKRATVMVRDERGVYMDTKKNRYTKYYVPIEKLI